MAQSNQQVIPMLCYEDGLAMMDWLIQAFGFVEQERWVEDGRLSHGELSYGDSTIMIASPVEEFQSMKTVAENYAPAREWRSHPYIFDGVLVYVDNIHAHWQRASAAGAVMIGEIQTGFPGTRYRAEDPEGHRWFFVQREG